MIANGSADLGVLSDSVGITTDQDPAKQHAAAVTAAEAAIAGDWSRDELRDVLASLGLDDLQEVPC